jgi:hypothetical protein
MKELIRHILREETKDFKERLRNLIDEKGVIFVMKLLGGIRPFKKIFNNDPEIISILDDLTGTVNLEYYSHYGDKNPFTFTFDYEIVGDQNNVWKTNSWPELNIIFDKSKLNDNDTEILKSIISTIINDNTIGKLSRKNSKLFNTDYYEISRMNGEYIDFLDDLFVEFDEDDVKRVHYKLYGESNNIQESKSNTALNFLKRRINNEDIIKAINSSIRFVNGFRDREEMEGDTFERIVLDATMDDFHPILSNSGNLPFDYDGIHNALHQLFHDYIMDKYVEYNNENDILMEEITSRRTGEEFKELPRRDQMNVKLLYNFLVANHMGIYEIKDSYVIALDDEGNNVAYLISKKNNQVTIDYNFNDKLISLIKDEGYRDDLVEIATYIFLDKHLPKEIKFNKDKKMGGGHIALY